MRRTYGAFQTPINTIHNIAKTLDRLFGNNNLIYHSIDSSGEWIEDYVPKYWLYDPDNYCWVRKTDTATRLDTPREII